MIYKLDIHTYVDLCIYEFKNTYRFKNFPNRTKTSMLYNDIFVFYNNYKNNVPIQKPCHSQYKKGKNLHEYISSETIHNSSEFYDCLSHLKPCMTYFYCILNLMESHLCK